MSLKSNRTLKSSKIKVGITMGDPSRIGPVIITKALKELKGLAEFIVIGDKWVFNQLPVPSSQFPVPIPERDPTWPA